MHAPSIVPRLVLSSGELSIRSTEDPARDGFMCAGTACLKQAAGSFQPEAAA